MILFTSYVSTRSSFHGLCLLKYNVLAQNRGASPLQIVRIPAGAAAGALAILIFPTYGEISAKMIGKSFIDIKEDEVNPPCFKVSFQFLYTMMTAGKYWPGLHLLFAMTSHAIFNSHYVPFRPVTMGFH